MFPGLIKFKYCNISYYCGVESKNNDKSDEDDDDDSVTRLPMMAGRARMMVRRLVVDRDRAGGLRLDILWRGF